ncbi:SUKH-4 family immunity protein [Streptomyces sp. BHT-5-2]|uniref:SUKH-4 family immunity protein n=1 Tax=Streptomyces sp. BHT-5-2 TaxID=2866715 RepID=UPI001C8D5AF8|nr:SUKH-4 family immunity protein [Streptomyces sp. BHT-5-2]QZL02367.1 SUKH-4 family immunity protein [Streptomyces sp. BHT-5-2]
MVTFAQAQERAERWVNGEVPSELHREVRVREFTLGFVAWAEDREGGPVGEGGRSRLVIARDSGETTLWPGLPVGEVIRRYEEEYGAPADGGQGAAEPPQRIDLEATSFLLTPPEWLQEAADAMGIGAGKGGTGAGADSGAAAAAAASGGAAGGGAVDDTSWAAADTTAGGDGEDRSVAPPQTVFAPPLAGSDDEDAPAAPRVRPDAKTELLRGGSQLPRTRISPEVPPPVGDGAGQSGAGVPGGLPPMPPAPPPMPPAPPVVPPAPPASSASSGAPGAPGATSGALRDLPPPTGAPIADVPPPPDARPGDGPAASGPAAGPASSGPGAAGTPAGGYVPTQLVSQLDAAELDLSAVDGTGAGAADGSGAAGSGSGSTSGPGSASGSGSGAGGAEGAGAAGGAGGARGGVHAAATMLADGAALRSAAPGPGGAAGHPGTSGGPGGPGGAGPGMPPPPPPGPIGAPKPPGASGKPGAAAGGHGPGGQDGPPPPPAPPPGAAGPGPGGGVHAAATMLAEGAAMSGGPGGPGGPGMPPAAGPGMPPASPMAPPAQAGPPPAPGPIPAPGPPPAPSPGPAPQGAPAPGAPGPGGGPGTPGAYGYPPAPSGQPTVGPGYMAVLSYRAPDGSEQKIVRRSAPGTPHPEWQLLHELRAMNVPPQQVVELHTELECCELPGGYCARMVRENWPQVRISHTAAYGTDHASRQQGVRHLIEHQGELHQVADGPARPAPVRAPLPHPSQVQPAPPVPPQAIGHELEQAFGPQGIFRFDQRAVSRQGVPDVVAQTLVWAGLPVDFGPFFWAQAQPGRPVPTLAELAAERMVQPAPDAGSYLVMGNDFGRQLCVQYGTANIVAVPLEAGPGGQSVAPQFVNTGLPEFVRCLAMLGRMWRLRYGLTPEQAGRWTVDFQAQLVALDPAALGSPETWWAVLLEQMWDGLL